MKTIVKPDFKAVVGNLVKERQDFLAKLVSGSSMIQITYKSKKLTCVYVRHTMETVTVQTTQEIVNHLWSNATLSLSGPVTVINVKFKLGEIQISND